MNYLALCCIAKDEDPFLKEWLTYHALLGVEHFYIYDNYSRVPIRQTLGEMADGKRVTIRRVPGKAVQLPVYNDCLESFGKDNQWIGFIDLDEFVCPMLDNDLRVLLSEFEDYAGLAATWHLMTSSGHLSRPRGPVVKNYTQAFAVQDSYTIKSFVRPEKTTRAESPHHFSFRPGHFCVNELHYPVSPYRQVTFAPGRLVRVNHYFLRSQQDFEEKLLRGRGATANPDDAYDMTMFLSSLERAQVEDRTIQRFLPELETALLKNRLPETRLALPPETAYEDRMEMALRLSKAGQPEKALLCLCGGAADHSGRADFWTLRAMLAEQAGQTSRSERFIRRSIALEATEAAYRHLRSLLLEKGENLAAEGVSAILRRYPEAFL